MDPLYLQVFFGGLTSGSIYAMIALGFTLVYRATGVINFANGEFAMVGALSAITILSGGVPLWMAILLGLLTAALVGVVMERAVVRPVVASPSFVLILVTIGASTFMRGGAMLLWGKDPLTLPAFSSGGSFVIGGAALLPQLIWIVGVVLLVVGLLSLFLYGTLYGKALRACAENRDAASLVGINVSTMIMLSFFLSAGIGAMAGVLIAPLTGMDYQAGFLLAMKGLTAAVIGGLERVTGAIVGAIVLGLIEAYTAAFISSLMKDAITFIVLIAVLAVRPAGLLGSRVPR